ncbi:two-component system LytT family response regulator [Aquimarina sp. EL_43]|uniref:LytR/AlgR family response regulator transcription factor n=1 Tax=unclassified Aquimarina TaxID=2627091 RepID=UPI0018CAE694|nr:MULTISPECIES: LytTR family DNA-binding domain-containing protein [unclassified Aquimarina]MBG6133368.1 two-component system LytT family response regulator [Aquimarina sp. EL_35]MBG6153453.1 two-component system LytT family response regulator [Aquimarina sp. EL_32]MBG6171609.1 two-component system LytT family response regulator [Aquimarina sp. EL_43]
MKVVLVEDEIAASDHLTFLLNSINSDIEILKVLDSVKSVIDYFSEPNRAELIFMDIHLADGISFEIFDEINIKIPIIFTTAYDQYAIKAFKVNSIDYLLKPIDEDELAEALKKFKTKSGENDAMNAQMSGMLQLLQAKTKSYKTTYLVHQRDELIPVNTERIAYFYIDTGVVKAITIENKTYIIDKKLEDIEEELNPENFNRVNRQFIIQKNAISNIKHYFNGKLIINISPVSKERIVVSKAKATEFKKWVNS